MHDIIKILPDSIANQIAAGEVVQRPSSIVKELLENSVDAGSNNIKLIIKDSGKNCIQIIDNGCGMSETDARLSFERHATSKIQTANDIFNIRTMGFRGEALASIASIANVELKTKRHNDELGTKIIIEGSEIIKQENINCANGTSIAVKNLFFNVPARRKFLKSDRIEFQHITEEFNRVALAFPDISFSFYEDDNLKIQLDSSNLKQRIYNLLGNIYKERLVPIEEKTSIVNINGFIVKPEFAKKKSKDDQYLFINNRFFKSSYLHHAIMDIYKELVPQDYTPSYIIFFETDPKYIDVNIHPTKTEIKFEDEKSVYSILRSAIKLSVGKFNISPIIDFNQENNFYCPPIKDTTSIKIPTITVNSEYNPFDYKADSLLQNKTKAKDNYYNKPDTSNWKSLYNNIDDSFKNKQEIDFDKEEDISSIENKSSFIQLYNRYILTYIKSGIIIIDHNLAHQRIIYEKLLKNNNSIKCQQLIFPETLELNNNDIEVFYDIADEINNLGFDVKNFGNNTIIIHGLPNDVSNENPKTLLENIICNYKRNEIDFKLDKRENLYRTIAKNISIKGEKKLTEKEMQFIIDSLFSCETPYYSPFGKQIIMNVSKEDLDKFFN